MATRDVSVVLAHGRMGGWIELGGVITALGRRRR